MDQQLIQRAGGGGNLGRGDGGVMRGGVDAAMAEQDLNDASVYTIVQQATGEGMPEAMGSNTLGKAGQLAGLIAGALQDARADVPVWAPGGEEKFAGGADDAVIGAKDL